MSSINKKNNTPPLFSLFEQKLQNAGTAPAIIESFSYYYNQLVMGERGIISENDIDPVLKNEILDYAESDALFDAGKSLLDKVAIIKLNGGLGTTMGLKRPKSLIEVRKGFGFLDVTVRQVLNYREKYKIKMPLLFMNSFHTDQATKDHLAIYDGLESNVPLTFLQSRFPKVLQHGLSPAEYPKNRPLEWNPPGHGEIYIVLDSSGMLEKLLEADIRYAFISNSDNLGAVMNARILGYFAESKAPLLMEVTRRKEIDKKGGHLARSKKTNRLLLRETAQCPLNERSQFQDIHRHKYFNTNNIWLDLYALKKHLNENNRTVHLPMIANPKKLNPRDHESPMVFQIETAMGSAISVFENATMICVPRNRFKPVKECADLLELWSDCYTFTEDYRLVENPERKLPPVTIKLDDRYYRMASQLKERFPYGAPSLIDCESLTIEGDVLFEGCVSIKGNVKIFNPNHRQHVISEKTSIDQARLDCGVLTLHD
ncbi:MAG: UTP--glucose-1-phosphate uridylyltransferase [Pseudomonadota bacterium]